MESCHILMYNLLLPSLPGHNGMHIQDGPFLRPNPPTGVNINNRPMYSTNVSTSFHPHHNHQQRPFHQSSIKPTLSLQPLQPMPRPSHLLHNNNNNYIKPVQLQQVHSPKGLFPIPTFEETLSPTSVPYEAIERVLSAHSGVEGGIV